MKYIFSLKVEQALKADLNSEPLWNTSARCRLSALTASEPRLFFCIIKVAAAATVNKEAKAAAAAQKPQKAN